MFSQVMLVGVMFCFQDGGMDPGQAPPEKPQPIASARQGVRPKGDVRLHVGLMPTYASLVGRLEKEDVSKGLGSGGDKVSYRSDLDLPAYIWSWRATVGLTAMNVGPGRDDGLQITGELMRTRGSNVLTQPFRHDGKNYVPGTLVRSRLEMALLDIDLHVVPDREFSDDSVLGRHFRVVVGVRLAQFRSLLEAPGQRASERTIGIWPRFGIRGHVDLNVGLRLWGEGIIGAWWYGEDGNAYSAASFDAEGGIAWSIEGLVEFRVGGRFQTMGIWVEQGQDDERITISRAGVTFGIILATW